VNNELETVSKKAVVVLSEVLSQHLAGGTQENLEKSRLE
jgi:hypothetical protein